MKTLIVVVVIIFLIICKLKVIEKKIEKIVLFFDVIYFFHHAHCSRLYNEKKKQLHSLSLSLSLYSLFKIDTFTESSYICLAYKRSKIDRKQKNVQNFFDADVFSSDAVIVGATDAFTVDVTVVVTVDAAASSS